jgi:hypothetical protein
VNINILAPEIGALKIGLSKQNGDFFSANGSNDFDEIVLTYGYSHPK